jgi:hypothetical protein
MQSGVRYIPVPQGGELLLSEGHARSGHSEGRPHRSGPKPVAEACR